MKQDATAPMPTPQQIMSFFKKRRSASAAEIAEHFNVPARHALDFLASAADVPNRHGQPVKLRSGLASRPLVARLPLEDLRTLEVAAGGSRLVTDHAAKVVRRLFETGFESVDIEPIPVYRLHLDELPDDATPMEKRDRAALLLLAEGWTRAEVAAMDVPFNYVGGTIQGRPMTRAASTALRNWSFASPKNLDERTAESGILGPVFVSFTRTGEAAGRLSKHSLPSLPRCSRIKKASVSVRLDPATAGSVYLSAIAANWKPDVLISSFLAYEARRLRTFSGNGGDFGRAQKA